MARTEPALQRPGALRSRSRRVWLAFALACIALAGLAASGCAVRLIAAYDETIDLTATRLQKSMDAFLTRMEQQAGDAATYAQNRQFYADYAVEVRSVLVRARAHPMNERTIEQYELMLDSLAELEASHQGEPGDEDAGALPVVAIPAYRDLFNQAWGAIIKLEVAKKR